MKLTEIENYKGDLKNGKPHGHGQLTLIDGEEYQGEYVGGWKEGKKDGYGVEFKSNEPGKYGYWKEGVYLGTTQPSDVDIKLIETPTIDDPALEQCIAIGEIFSVNIHNGHNVVILKVPEYTGMLYYPFRFLFYKNTIHSPFLAINMEFGSLGTSAYGAHTPRGHESYGGVEKEEMTFDHFLQWVEKNADRLIGESLKLKV